MAAHEGWGGSRSNSGRKRQNSKSFDERVVRIKIYKEDHEKWKELKAKANKTSDPVFCQYLLDLASKDMASSTSPQSIALTADCINDPRPIISSPHDSTFMLPSYIEEEQTSTPISRNNVRSGRRPLFASTTNSPVSSMCASLSTTLAVRTEDPCTSESEISLDTDDASSNESIDSVISQMNVDESNDSDSENEHEFDLERIDSEDDAPVPSDARMPQTQAYEAASDGQKRVIVNVDKLVELACRSCRQPGCTGIVSVSIAFRGSAIQLTMKCDKGHSYSWMSSNLHYNDDHISINENDLMFAASILYSGNHFAKVEHFCSIFSLKCINEAMYYRYQRIYLIPVVNRFWKHHQDENLKMFEGQEVILSGDGRCDSPGSSAKYCTYSFMEPETGIILHAETVDKREVQYKSPVMECEGLRRGICYLTSANLKIKEITTDASTSIIGMLAKEHPDIIHSLDVWHKAKKLRKILNEVGQKKNMDKIRMWADAIYNHFWFCCSECNEDVEVLKSMWISVLHHVQNEHIWILGKCRHVADDGTDMAPGPPTDADGRIIPYFDKAEPALNVLKKIVLDPNWIGTLKYYVRFRHTGGLESFHSLVLSYCPKRIAFKDEAYRARTMLAIVDHNSHLKRKRAVNEEGEERSHRTYRKRTKRWDVVPVLEKKSYAYIPKLIDLLFEFRAEYRGTIRASTLRKRSGHPDLISPTISMKDPPPTTEIVASKKSRFETINK